MTYSDLSSDFACFLANIHLSSNFGCLVGHFHLSSDFGCLVANSHLSTDFAFLVAKSHLSLIFCILVTNFPLSPVLADLPQIIHLKNCVSSSDKVRFSQKLPYFANHCVTLLQLPGIQSKPVYHCVDMVLVAKICPVILISSTSRVDNFP